jgi:microcystin-dependent protein
LNSGDAVTPTYSTDQTYDTFIGTVFLLSYASSAQDHIGGFALCRGQTLPIASPWDVLYSLLGNRFGGNGTTTFALPTIASDPGTLPSGMVYDGLYPSRS